MKHAAGLAEGIDRLASAGASVGMEGCHGTISAQEWYFFSKTNIPGGAGRFPCFQARPHGFLSASALRAD
jgi:hypothetical protein